MKPARLDDIANVFTLYISYIHMNSLVFLIFYSLCVLPISGGFFIIIHSLVYTYTECLLHCFYDIVNNLDYV